MLKFKEKERHDSSVSKHQEKEVDAEENCYRRSMGEGRNSLLLCCIFGPEQLVLAFMMILIVLLIFLHSQKQESSSDTISEAAVSIVHTLSGSSSSKEKGKALITPLKLPV